MKRITIVSILAAVLLLTGFVVARAESRGWHGWYGHHGHRFGPASYLAHELKLTDPQRAQIQSLWQVERPIVSDRVHELLAENREMNELTGNGSPDPAQVQKIADREAGTIAALLVEKVQLESKINSSVLTPEQRAKADELRKKWDSHLEHFADRLADPKAAQRAPSF
jgi:Spy/CpxP family protein refolding chaperone